MKRKRTSPISTIIIIIGLLTSSGCAAFELPNESGALLFQDDFSSTTSGWDRAKTGTYSAEYNNGSYKIEVFHKNHEVWALPGLFFSDVIIEVTATKTNGPDDNVFGILCRFQDPQNFYFFLISSDGYAGIGLYQDGKRTLLSGDSMLPSETIAQAPDGNVLKARCIGDQLSLDVNGSLVYEVHSDTLQAGDVGLITGSYEQTGITVLFDDFSVRNP